jgi:hypothetical protein
MSSDGKRKQHVFKLGTGTDIVDYHQSTSISRSPIHHNANVREVAWKNPRDDVGGQIVVRVVCYGKLNALPAKENLKVWYPSVVYAAVGLP